MHFIAVILLLLLGRYRRFPDLAERWGKRYLIPVSTAGWVVLAVVTGLMEYLLLQAAGLFWLGLALLVQTSVLYLLLPHWAGLDLTGRYYTHWCRGDYQAAYLELQKAGDIPGAPAAEQPQSCRDVHFAVCARYTAQAGSGFFFVLFWFACLGLPGVFIGLWAQRRFLSGQPAQQSNPFTRIILWLPAQLLGYTFFAVGNARSAHQHLRAEQGDDQQAWLLAVALGAIDDKLSPQSGENSQAIPAGQIQMSDEEYRHHAADELQALKKLVRRAAVLWLLVFGVLTMLGFEAPLY